MDSVEETGLWTLCVRFSALSTSVFSERSARGQTVGEHRSNTAHKVQCGVYRTTCVMVMRSTSGQACLEVFSPWVKSWV